MLKKITFCFLAALLICLFTIFAFAAEWSAESAAYIMSSVGGFLSNDLETREYRYYLSDDTTFESSVAISDPYVRIYFDGIDYAWLLYGTYNGNTQALSSAYVAEWTIGEGEVTIVSDDEGANLDDAITLFNTYVADVLTPIEAENEPVYIGIFSVFTQITTWIVGALGTVVALFWANGSLTFFGILTLIALGIAIFWLFCRLISNFLQFRS